MDIFKGTKVVVSGASGFVGAHLVAALESTGAEVFALVREHSSLGRLNILSTHANRIVVDLLDYEAVGSVLADIQANHVFHTAVARDKDHWQATLDMNCAATLNLLQACLSPALKTFVHCGSSLEYGEIKAPFRESDGIRPNTFFGASKAAATLQLQQLALAQGLPVVVLRLFHVYGILDNERRLVPTVIRNFLSGKPVALTEPGYCHDFVYIDDVVKACLTAAAGDGLAGQVINIASGHPVTNEHVVALLGTIMGKHSEILSGAFAPREWDKANWHADISLAREKLGWQPDTNLEDGLEKCVAWQLENE